MQIVTDVTFETTNPRQALALARRHVYRTFSVWRSWSADVLRTTDTHITVRIAVTA